MTSPPQPGGRQPGDIHRGGLPRLRGRVRLPLGYSRLGQRLCLPGRHARHYYLAHFPCTGQQYRAGHLWAAISKVDASGWARVLRTEIVPGIASEIGLWHRVRLQVRGPEIRLWLDDRPFPVVTDDSYAEPGYVGLETFNGRDPAEAAEQFGDARPRVGSGNSFRNVRVRGETASAPPWDPTVAPSPSWRHPLPGTAHGRLSIRVEPGAPGLRRGAPRPGCLRRAHHGRAERDAAALARRRPDMVGARSAAASAPRRRVARARRRPRRRIPRPARPALRPVAGGVRRRRPDLERAFKRRALAVRR